MTSKKLSELKAKNTLKGDDLIYLVDLDEPEEDRSNRAPVAALLNYVNNPEIPTFDPPPANALSAFVLGRYVTFNVSLNTTGTFSVDWGDGHSEVFTLPATNEFFFNHAYEDSSFYNIVLEGDLNKFFSNSNALIGIESFPTGLKSLVLESLNLETLPSSVSGLEELRIRLSERFNQNLNSWDVSSVTTFTNMFNDARIFNQPLNSWNTSNVTSFDSMFWGATSFNQPLNSWDVSSATSFSSMFFNASTFNQPLNSWDTSNVTFFNAMFSGARNFNQPLNSWDVSSVTSFQSMFFNARNFNQPLNSWDVSSATSFSFNSMFSGALSFNQDLSSWDTSNVASFSNMFSGATSFNQDLSSWDFTGLTNSFGLQNFLSNTAMNVTNINLLFQRWDNQKGSMPTMTNVGLLNCPQPTGAGATARTNLEAAGWTFIF
jgi:surface protein